MELMKNKKGVAFVSLGLVAAMAIGGVALNANAAIKVNTYTASLGSLTRNTEINGNVVSNNSVSYYSKIDGRIAEIKVREGDFVKRGDPNGKDADGSDMPLWKPYDEKNRFEMIFT